MFKSKFSKVCALILAFGISFSTCSMSYADSTVIGKPNSIHEEYNRDGSLKQRRQFGKNGQAEKDVDYSHGGIGHKFPHVHDWNWKDGKPNRDNSRKPKEGELQEMEEKAKEVAKGITVGTALGTALYFIVSEGSRVVFPPRNLIPIL